MTEYSKEFREGFECGFAAGYRAGCDQAAEVVDQINTGHIPPWRKPYAKDEYCPPPIQDGLNPFIKSTG